jgi:hypothetical protein
MEGFGNKTRTRSSLAFYGTLMIVSTPNCSTGGNGMGDSPEQVAYKLLETIADVERKLLRFAIERDRSPGWTIADKEWILGTYADCLRAVKGRRPK